jgi:hypothetical protein
MASDQGALPLSAILWSVEQWADAWGCSERKAHQLRKHMLFPNDAEVHLGVRNVRFRVNRLAEFAAALAAERQTQAEPERLRKGREAKRAAVSWPPRSAKSPATGAASVE